MRPCVAANCTSHLVQINWCSPLGISPLGSRGSWIKGEILKKPILLEIAEKLKKSTAQVALRWGIQSGHSVLPISVHNSRIKENFSLFDGFIPPELFSKFSAIHQVNVPQDIHLHLDTCMS